MWSILITPTAHLREIIRSRIVHSLLAITSLEASLGEDTRSPPSPLVPKLLPAQVENMVMMIMTQTPMGAIIMAFPHSALMTAVATSHVTTTYGTEMCLGTHLTKTSGLPLIQVLFSNFGIIKLKLENRKSYQRIRPTFSFGKANMKRIINITTFLFLSESRTFVLIDNPTEFAA